MLELDRDESVDVKEDILRAIENASDIYYQNGAREKTLR
jgi:hypothetical protein